MKQFTFLIGCIFGGILNCSAQTFFATPGPLYEQTVALNQANLCYIYFDNPSGDSLQVRWRKLEASMPQGWDADICDYGTCYFGVPNTALMHWVHDTIQPYLKLVVQPGAIEGAAWFWFRVSEEGNTSNFEDVYYSLHTIGVSSVQNPVTSLGKVYPNPSNGVVWVENNTGTSALALLSDETGRLLASQKMEPNTATHLTGELLEPGVYYLRISGQTHKIIVQR